jgi:hypothetical protein
MAEFAVAHRPFMRYVTTLAGGMRVISFVRNEIA